MLGTDHTVSGQEAVLDVGEHRRLQPSRKIYDWGWTVRICCRDGRGIPLCRSWDYSETREDHAACVQSWLTVLKGDKRAIFTAASHSQKAADYLHSLQPQT
jgi:hypothetical protein